MERHVLFAPACRALAPKSGAILACNTHHHAAYQQGTKKLGTCVHAEKTPLCELPRLRHVVLQEKTLPCELPRLRRAASGGDRASNQENPAVRAAEAHARRVRRENPAVRAAETDARRVARDNPDVRAAETDARRVAREDPAVRAADILVVMGKRHKSFVHCGASRDFLERSTRAARSHERRCESG
eukprot:365157-Chlamydomonas_euryale.AAC.5